VEVLGEVTVGATVVMQQVTAEVAVAQAAMAARAARAARAS